MNIQVDHALDVQEELKTIAMYMYEIENEYEYKKLGWNIDLTEENSLEPDIWIGNNHVVDPSQVERRESLIKVKSLITVSKFKHQSNDTYHVVVDVDLPDEYDMPIKSFECEYEYKEDELPLGFPQAFYEAYKYFDEITDFSYADKLSYLAGAMWEFAHALGYLLCAEFHGELADIIVADTVWG
jgi:hypothetical protein